MAITKGNIRSWAPYSLTVNGVDWGAMGEDGLQLQAGNEKIEVRCGMSVSVIKRIISSRNLNLVFTVLENTLDKWDDILNTTAYSSPTLYIDTSSRDLSTHNIAVTIHLSDGGSVTIQATVEFEPGIDLRASIKEIGSAEVTAYCIPDTDNSDRLATLTYSATSATQLAVSSSNPADAATGVAVSVSPTVVFNIGIMSMFATDEYFVLAKADGTVVATSVSYASATKTVTVNPTSDLDASSSYIIVISKSIKPLAGTKMSDPVVINFATV